MISVYMLAPALGGAFAGIFKHINKRAQRKAMEINETSEYEESYYSESA